MIVDESKIVPRLGTRGPLPVEITPFEAGAHVQWLSSLGCRAELWLEEDGSLVVTDNGNYLALLSIRGRHSQRACPGVGAGGTTRRG